MLDAAMRKLIDPPLNDAGRVLSKMGITANQMTLAGLSVGLAAAIAIASGNTWLGLFFIALSRLADGLDGAVARATRKTDFGGFLDIASDFFFYGAIPFGFIIANPGANALAGAFLLFSFYFNGATFLGYAVLGEKHRLVSHSQGAKTLYYTAGLLEGTETIAFFVTLCIWPHAFAALAWVFGLLCFVTGGARLLHAYQAFPATRTTSAPEPAAPSPSKPSDLVEGEGKIGD